MSGVTRRPRCPLIISIIQEGVIAGSDCSGPTNPSLFFRRRRSTTRPLVACEILDYVVTYDDRWILWWPALLRFAGYERILRENSGFLMVRRFLFGVACAVPNLHTFSTSDACFDLFPILWPNVLGPCERSDHGFCGPTVIHAFPLTFLWLCASCESVENKRILQTGRGINFEALNTNFTEVWHRMRSYNLHFDCVLYYCISEKNKF